MNPFFPFMHENTKKEAEPQPLYIELYPPPPPEKREEEIEEKSNIIIIEL